MYVGASDIARLLELKNPAVVTNWRSRYQSFPAERVGGGQPRFDLVEVLEWLRNDGPRGRAVDAVAPLAWWAEVVRAFVVFESRKHPLRNAALALVLVRQLAMQRNGGDEWKQLLEVATTPVDSLSERPMGIVFGAHAALRRIAEWAERSEPLATGLLMPSLFLDDHLAKYACDLVGALERAAEVPAHDLAEVVVNSSVDGQQRHDPRRTIDDLAALMVALARPSAGDTIFDPAVGEGTLLLEAMRRAGHAQAVAQEADWSTHGFTRLRFLIEQQSLDLGAKPADSLNDDQHRTVRADLVLLDPPLEPRSTQLARWIDFGLEHLAPSGRMVMALPLNELVSVRSVRRLPDERVRGRLLELASQARLRSVVVVPRWARTDVAGPMAVISVGAPQQNLPIVIVNVGPSGRRTDPLGEHGRAMIDVLHRDGVEGLLDADIDGIEVDAATADDALDVLEELAGDESIGGALGARQRGPQSAPLPMMARPARFARMTTSDVQLDFARASLDDPLDELIERLRVIPPSKRAAIVTDFLRQLDER